MSPSGSRLGPRVCTPAACRGTYIATIDAHYILRVSLYIFVFVAVAGLSRSATDFSQFFWPILPDPVESADRFNRIIIDMIGLILI